MRLAFLFHYLHTKRRRTGFQYHANRVNKVTIISKHYKRVRDHLSGFLKMERGERMSIFVMPTFRLLLHVRLLLVCFCVLRVNEYATNSNCAIPFVPQFIQNYINLKKQNTTPILWDTLTFRRGPNFGRIPMLWTLFPVFKVISLIELMTKNF